MPIESPSETDAVVLVRAFGTGLLVWGLGTVGFRVAGQHILFADPAALLVLFAAVGAVMAVLGPCLRHAIGAAKGQADLVALLMILPGMLLDGGATGLFAEVFPNMAVTLAPYFGALMLWGYAIAGGSIALEARIGRVRLLAR